MRIERLLAAALVAGSGLAVLPTAMAQSGPAFRGEIEVWLGGTHTCALSVTQATMPPGAMTFVVENGARRGYSVTLDRTPGRNEEPALGADGALRRDLFVDGLPAALPSGATAVFTPTLKRGRYDVWCTDKGQVRSPLSHASFTVGARAMPSSQPT